MAKSADPYIRAICEQMPKRVRGIPSARDIFAAIDAGKPVHRMLDISEGVMQMYSQLGEERFEASVQTNEGKKTLAGRVQVASRMDIQSGAVLEHQVSLHEASERIRWAYDHLPVREAIKEIAGIWEQLDRTAELAAARSRILIGKLPTPRLAPAPKWFEDAREELSKADDGVVASPTAIKSAELLIRAALARLADDRQLSAEVEIGPMGRVSIDWYIPQMRLYWLVDAIDTPWPTVKVYQVSIDVTDASSFF